MTAILRAAPAVGVTVVATAAVQAGLVALAIVPSSDIGFMLMAAASLVVAMASMALLSTQIASSVQGTLRVLPTGATIGWSALVGVVVFLATILLQFSLALLLLLVPVVLTFGLATLPLVAAGRHPLAGFRAWRSAPARSVLVVLTSMIAIYVSYLASIALGLLITGWLGAGTTWIAFGSVAALLLWWWSVRALRGRPQD